MWAERTGIVLTAAIVVLLVGATIAVYAMDPMPDRSQTPQPVDGRTVFLTKGCTSCHNLADVSRTGGIGPDLTGLAARAGDRVEGLAAEDYIRQSVLDPQAFLVKGYGGIEMPTLPLNNEDLDALVEFLLDET